MTTPRPQGTGLLERHGIVVQSQNGSSGEVIKELRPCRVGNTCGQTMIVNYSGDMQIFNTDGSKRVDNPSALLVGEIAASPFDAFMHTSDHLAMPAPLLGAFVGGAAGYTQGCNQPNSRSLSGSWLCPMTL